MSINKVTNKGIICISKALQNNTSLKILNISRNYLSADGVLKFSEYLVGKNTLHKLMISWSNRHLDLNFNVTLLNLSQEYYGVTGAILVSSFLYYKHVYWNLIYLTIK